MRNFKFGSCSVTTETWNDKGQTGGRERSRYYVTVMDADDKLLNAETKNQTQEWSHVRNLQRQDKSWHVFKLK